MILNKDQIKQLYQRTARFYDIALLGYRLLGVTKYRRDTIKGLQLKAGDTVVDLGCGTGANTAYEGFKFKEIYFGAAYLCIGEN